MPQQFGSAAHQMYLDRISRLDHGELGLLKIALDAIGIAIDERDDLGPNGRVLADYERKVGDEAVYRRPNDGPLEVEGGGRQVRRGLIVCSGRRGRGELSVLLVLR